MQALEECVRALDPASRALLDLSLRRRLPLEAMAAVLHTDPFDLARRRARAVARIAADLDLDGPGVIACVRSALTRLADEAWLVPLPAPPKPPVQAEEMASQARALMERLRARQEAEREARLAAPPPMSAAPTSPFSVGLARIADENEDSASDSDDVVVVAPPPLGEALRRAAEAERAATPVAETVAPEPIAPEPEPEAASPEVVEGSAETIEFVAVVPEPAPVVQPATDLIVIHRPTAKRIARGGVIVAIIAAILRFLFRH
jgi:hypothetical protein